MKSKNLVIYDSEEDYARALALFFSRKKELMFQVHVCSSMEHVMELDKEKTIDFLLLDEEYVSQLEPGIKKEKVFLLSVKTKIPKKALLPGTIRIYKYQAGEKILSDMVQGKSDLFGPEDMLSGTAGGKKKKIIGVFSPVHRIGKTGYALKLGEQLAEKENVLYLNLEVFGGIGGYFEKRSQTMADVLYYARQEKSNLGFLLTTLVGHKGNLDYVQPMPVSEDMKSVKGSEWGRLIQRIMSESIYETVILDIDEAVPELYELLKVCTRIHMPIKKDAYAMAKVQQFEQEIHLLGLEGIQKKLIRKEIKR